MDLPTQIQDQLDALGILAADVEERFVRGSGPGGQKINKTASTVCLMHRPSGTSVRCQRERSRSLNRELAWAELCEKIDKSRRAELAARRSAAEKARRKARPKSRRQKAIQVAGKRHRAQIKAGRGRPLPE